MLYAYKLTETSTAISGNPVIDPVVSLRESPGGSGVVGSIPNFSTFPDTRGVYKTSLNKV